MRGVALPSGASYCCRIGVNIVFMAAFGIPVTAFTVFLVASSHMLSGLFAITPGGVGQTQALDVATLRAYADTSSIAAFSITQDADPHDLERRPRHRGHALGVRLPSGEADALEEGRRRSEAQEQPIT